ncbi:hypothetical protein HDV06_000254 [Boothiomyces sp. JEL0866]|nr:hypothetical protein HDV06_000254 [Boothiomyces sp. JEL0866]
MNQDYTLLLLSDSALPVGGFVCSSGLEAAIQTGNYRDLKFFIKQSLLSVNSSTVPFIKSTFECLKILDLKKQEPSEDELPKVIDRILELDHKYDTMIGLNHISKRASLQQGIAYLSLSTKSFSFTNVFKRALLKQEGGHLPICFTIVCSYFDLPLERIIYLYLFLQMRSIISSAIRLSLIGPYEGQQILFEEGTLIDHVMDIGSADSEDEGYSTWPLLDIVQGCHDRLYTRIFNS